MPIANWDTFEHGEFGCTVLSDGIIQLGPACENFPSVDPDEINQVLTDYYMPTDKVLINQNVLLVNTGDKLVMFDCGVGTDPALGGAEFNPGTGLLLSNMRAAGVDPAEIDIVALTHAHPDHSWGLVDGAGRRVFPNAQVAVSRAEYEYWTDLSRVETARTGQQRVQFRGAHKNLTAYSDQLMLLEGGDVVVPGVQAIATPGHSPGHLVYDIVSSGAHMVCWGDLCHHEVLLLRRPDWSIVFDWNGPQAIKQRYLTYRRVHEGRLAVFGYHFPYPGLGHLRQDGDGYSWIPADLQRDHAAG